MKKTMKSSISSEKNEEITATNGNDKNKQHHPNNQQQQHVMNPKQTQNHLHQLKPNR